MNHDGLLSDEFKEKIFRAAINKVANSDIYTLEMGEFVKTFTEVARPEGFNHLFLVDYGTLAVENAFKVAMDWKVNKLLAKGRITPGQAVAGTKGTKIIHFNEAFHGRGGYTLSVTNTADPNKTQRFAKFQDWPRIINPKLSFPLTESSLALTEWTEEQAIKQIKTAIANDPDGHCAIIIETIQGEGGDNHFRTEFFKKMKEICVESDLMLIFDEVQCGMGITGKMWAWQYHVSPDIFTFGKKSQVCGIFVGPRVDEVEKNCFNVSSRINSTWGGTVVDMVRSTRYLEIYREENTLDYVANNAGPALMKGLEDLAREFPDFISNVRGKGLMCAFDIKTPELRGKFLKSCADLHMLILACGTRTVRFRPALNVPLSDISKGMEISREAARRSFK
jgi:L-lysine 6-transaminase